MQCDICEIGCFVPDGATGACKRYKNENGLMTELFPDSYLVVCPISAETMPILHFHPKAKFLQISTAGCNFSCEGCVATVVAKEVNPDSGALKHMTPEQIVQRAKDENCEGVVFLMNDPLASFYTFLDVARLARENGLFTGCSSNGYFTLHSLDLIADYLDFVNIGIKGLSDDDYISCGAPGFAPVLRNIRLFHERGVHVEAACMHKKGCDAEVVAIADAVASVSPDIPLQIMRFIPLDDADINDEPSINESEQAHSLASEKLKYVYLFNSPGTSCLDTFCPECGELIFKRDFYGPMGSKLRKINLLDGAMCPVCGHRMEMTGVPADTAFNENDFEGGYPFTRALEIIEGTLAAIGVTGRKEIVKCWEDTLKNSGVRKLHDNIQDFESYAKKINFFGELTGREEQAKRLAGYMRGIISEIKAKTENLESRPRVYYTMGRPLFAMVEDRLENELVEMAGGISVNKTLGCKGRPGMGITAGRLNGLNPDVMFISSFMHSSLDDYYKACEDACVNVEATRNGRVYNYPAPCMDFGSPRWILGLMHIANCLHPELFSYDVEKEAERFYKTFYGIDYRREDVNRSFARPSRAWAVGK